MEVAREFDAAATEEDDTLDLFLQQLALVADADSPATEEGLVTLMTLHNAKGLEYPIVFIAGCEDGFGWSGERRVDGVFVVDLRISDPRPDALVRLGLPAVILSGSSGPHPVPTVWQNEAEVVVGAVRYLAALGHRRIARVGGVVDFLQTETRNAAYLATIEDLGLVPIVVATDFRAETGAHVTRQLLAGPRRPTAFIYENDILAVAGLGVAHEMGLHVPRDVSIIAWDDSPFCQVVHPLSRP